MANRRSMINVRANLHTELVKLRDRMREDGKPKASISDALETCLAEGLGFYRRYAAIEGQCGLLAANLVACIKTYAASIAAAKMDAKDVAVNWQGMEPLQREQALWTAYHNVSQLTNRQMLHNPQSIIPQLARDVEPPQCDPDAVQSAFDGAKEAS